MDIKFRIEYSEAKDLILKSVRGIGFDEIKEAILKGKILDDIDHFKPDKYPNQRIFILKVKGYIYAVPYVIDKKRKILFLKTIYPSRSLKRKYLK